MVKRSLLAMLLVVSGFAVVSAEPPGNIPGWVRDLSGTQNENNKTVPWSTSSSAALGASQATESAAFSFPAAQSWEVAAGKEAPGKVVQVSAQQPLRLEILDRAAAQRNAVSGFVFKVSNMDSNEPTASVKMAVDYSSFANAYGGSYGSRLQLVSLPQCALQGCSEPGKPVASSNDLQAQKLTAEVSVDGASVLAVTAGASGDQGSFAATPLSLSGSWQVSPGSGAFNYSYPIDIPKPGAGSAPSLSLGYSSSSIDGMTFASNTQASPSGVGWSDFANAYVERRYEPCYRTVGTTDLCWKSDNATLSLGGISGALIPVNSPANTEWKLQSDPGWRVERTSGAVNTTIYGNQMWKVTGPDGTQYIFGGGHMPGRYTNSVLGVAVLADQAGEPCRGAGNTVGACLQGWRWYLDRVIDPDGNVHSYLYEKEQNYYSAIGGIGNNEKYDRGALLKEIIYGGHGWDAATYSARVLFGNEYRCGFLVANCPAAVPNASGFPDVPTDLICNSATKGTCSVHTPSFFTTKRYAWVRTEVKVGSAWKPVAQHNIYHSFGDGQNGVAYKLQVKELQHAAIAFGKLNAYPTTKFGYKILDNRADHDGNIPKAMRHVRINKVTNPFGGSVNVTYGQNRNCSTSYDPFPRWDNNVRDCFPQSVRDGNFTATGVFNKYLVTDVSENDGYTADALTSHYDYEGDPAWAFDFGAFARDEDETGWSSWRGYGQVSVRKGTSWTRYTLFRGWNHDAVLELEPISGDLVLRYNRIAKVIASDGSTFDDDMPYAGRTLEEQQLGTIDGVAGSIVLSRIHRYEKRLVHGAPGYVYPVEWVGLASTTESVATARNVFRQRRSQTTYNAHFQPTATLEEGWLDVTGDERCSITTYADNEAAWMFVYPSGNKKVAGSCASTSVLTQSQTFYDSFGNPVRQRMQLDSSTWSETTTEFDVYGRPVKITDPNGKTVLTAYSVTAGAPASQIPVRTVLTNSLGHQKITDYVPEFGVPSRQQEANGNATHYGYDEFGRTETVWLPTEPPDYAEPSFRFSYDIPNRSVRSRRLVSADRTGPNVVFEDAWVVYDGLWRERQVQGLSSVSGKALVAETTYDNRGLVYDETVEQALTGTPGKYLAGGASWLNRTRNSYDELGRKVRQDWFRGSTVARTTVTSYGVDAVTVTGPDGRRVRERTDGLGRTAAVEEFDGQAWASSSYGYDLADRLKSVIDPAGNKIEYSYNMAGWRVGQVDPNRGNALFGYDLAGNQTTVWTDSGPIFTTYDPLGRPTSRRADSTAGPLLASWQYDTATNGKGKLARSDSGGWVTETLGFDIKGRPLGYQQTVPPGIAGLSGSYSTEYTYDRADRVRTVKYPAIGGLPAETITTDYSNLGLLTRIAGLEEYVPAVSYDDRGRKVSAGLGPEVNGTPWMAKNWTYDVDQKLNGTQTYAAPNGIIADHQWTYDTAGNLKEKLTKQGTLSWRECFGYDARARLTSAQTVAAASSCADGQPGTGDRPYRSTYQHSADGKLLSRTEDGVSTAYTYPAAGSLKPHAPAKISNDTYTWDAEGKLTTRNVSGQAETFAWDKQDRLTSVTTAAGATTFVYDTAGQRLLRRTPDGRSTLYFAGQEITVNSSGAPVTAARPYTLDGQIVATRTLSGVDYLVTDPAGSVEMAIPSGGTAPSATRAYLPYGRVRAETGDMATDRGFIGQIEDSSTKLSYLNERYYDARTGIFLSADALFDTSKVKSLNPYTYASGNPATFTDPSGMYSQYTWAMERENAQLREINGQLIAHIGVLNNQIAEMQDVIRKQSDAINRMLTYIDALEAEIARQASIIERLQQRVAYLERVVAVQQREIGRLRGIIARQQAVIQSQAGIIRYYKGVVDTLGFRLWGGTPQHASVMESIHSFRGIPEGAFAYDNISLLQGQVYQLTSDLAGMTASREAWHSVGVTGLDTTRRLRADLDDANATIDSKDARIQELLDEVDSAGRATWGDVATGALGMAKGTVGLIFSVSDLADDIDCASGFRDWRMDNITSHMPDAVQAMATGC